MLEKGLLLDEELMLEEKIDDGKGKLMVEEEVIDGMGN